MKKANNKKNEMVVDLTNITLDDVYKAFAIAKFNTMRPAQRECVAHNAVNECFDDLRKDIDNYFADMEKDQQKYFATCENCARCECCYEVKSEAKVKKPNVFRRFWNWITRK